MIAVVVVVSPHPVATGHELLVNVKVSQSQRVSLRYRRLVFLRVILHI